MNLKYLFLLLLPLYLLTSCGNNVSDSKDLITDKNKLLNITVFADSSQIKSNNYRINCDREETFCKELLESGLLEKPNPEIACTEIYGGPQKIVLSDAKGNKLVNSEFTRVNGCEIARYDSLKMLLQELETVKVELSDFDVLK